MLSHKHTVSLMAFELYSLLVEVPNMFGCLHRGRFIEKQITELCGIKHTHHLVL
jgi:hypothetical protein